MRRNRQNIYAVHPTSNLTNKLSPRLLNWIVGQELRLGHEEEKFCVFIICNFIYVRIQKNNQEELNLYYLIDKYYMNENSKQQSENRSREYGK